MCRKLLYPVTGLALVALLLGGCNSPTVTLVSPTAANMPISTSQSSTPTVQEPTETPAPETTMSNTTITYGYANSIPLAIVSPVDGLRVSLHDVTYTTVNDIWVLGEYQISIISPSGKIDEIQFLNFEYGENLSPVGYSVLENGTSLSGPSPEDFNAENIESGVGLYPSGYEIGLSLMLPCSVASSNDEYTKGQFFDIWVDLLSKRTVICKSGEKYIFTLDEYDYMDTPSLKPSRVTLSVSVSQ